MKIIVIKENMSRFEDLVEYVNNLYRRGAKEVHLKILSPMLNYDCLYSMNNMQKDHIKFNETGIKEYLNLSSIEFITDENMMLAIKKYDNTSKICINCINNR